MKSVVYWDEEMRIELMPERPNYVYLAKLQINHILAGIVIGFEKNKKRKR
jgi:hypothetical protein